MSSALTEKRMFNKEADFENALIALVCHQSWEKEVLRLSHRRRVNCQLAGAFE